MADQPIVERADWLRARQELLDEEKAFTKARDALAQKRRKLPWVRVEKDYEFEGPQGVESLANLFAGKGQLVVYHFMYGPDWGEGCPSCSFWADNFDGIDIHLAHRDTTLVAVSNTSLSNINTYRKRLGWEFKWVSSLGSDFNRDFHVTFTQEELDAGPVEYNFTKSGSFPSTEAPGLSVFARLSDGGVAHAYSSYSRGLDIINGAYHILDLTPKGRDEDDLPFSMAWVRRRDQYDD